MVEVAATETDLPSIEPLEPPFHGDCDLAEIKRLFGKRLALKGNIRATRLLMATPEEGESMNKCVWMGLGKVEATIEALGDVSYLLSPISLPSFWIVDSSDLLLTSAVTSPLVASIILLAMSHFLRRPGIEK